MPPLDQILLRDYLSHLQRAWKYCVLHLIAMKQAERGLPTLSCYRLSDLDFQAPNLSSPLMSLCSLDLVLAHEKLKVCLCYGLTRLTFD